MSALRAETCCSRRNTAACGRAVAIFHPVAGLPPPALPVKVLMTYDRGYHFGISDATGDNTVELFGRLQVDTGGCTGYSPGPETPDRKGLSIRSPSDSAPFSKNESASRKSARAKS